MGPPRHNHQVIEADKPLYRLYQCKFSLNPGVLLRVHERDLSIRMNGSFQAYRAISTGKLHALLRFHTRPINVVVFHGSQGRTSFEGGFLLRCFQRLSLPYLATLLCHWRDNRSTRDTSTPVLSY